MELNTHIIQNIEWVNKNPEFLTTSAPNLEISIKNDMYISSLETMLHFQKGLLAGNALVLPPPPNVISECAKSI